MDKNKKFLALLVLPLWAWGCAALDPLEVREGRYGKAVPVITNSFASQQIRPGDTWKVYLNASDPDGDMKNIVCTIDQPGKGVYPVSYTRIAEANRKELSGFIYLNTVGGRELNFVTLSLSVQIQDKAGHFSQPAVFPLSFNLNFEQAFPPVGTFQEKDLGPILITLRPLSDDGERNFFEKSP